MRDREIVDYLQDITGMRDKLIHEYHGVDKDTVWQTLHEDIPPLKSMIEEIFNKES